MRNTIRRLALLVVLAITACSGQAMESGSTPAQVAMPTQAAPPAFPVPTETIMPPQTVTPAQAARSLAIGNSIWRWTRLVNRAGAATNNASPDRYTIQFRPAEGLVNIRSDCQSASGTFSANEQKLTIKLTATTNAMCAPDSLADLFLGLVSQVEVYSFQGDMLVLKLGGDGGTLYLLP